jgi:hypothetical protein
LEQTLIEVWRQTLVELGTERYPVRRTPKRRLREVDFLFDETQIRGLDTEPGNEIPVGADGTVWREGDAISERASVRGKRG